MFEKPLTPDPCSAQWAPLATLPAGLHRHTTASGKRAGKVSQEFNLCLFSCTPKAFLVLLFKASRHSCTPSCYWGLPMETLWAGLPSPSISTLLRYRAREKPTLCGAHSSCPLQEAAVVYCRGAARSQLPPHIHHLWVPSSNLCHPREAEEKSHSTQAISRAPHPTLPPCWVQMARHPQRSRERNDLLLPPLLFCKQGSLYS